MKRAVNRLLSAWLVIGLMVAPLQAAAISSAPATGAAHACPMQAHGQADHAHMLHGAAASSAAPCPDCAGDACDNSHCSDNGCSALQLPLTLTATARCGLYRSLSILFPPADSRLHSLPPAPLFRPPV